MKINENNAKDFATWLAVLGAAELTAMSSADLSQTKGRWMVGATALGILATALKNFPKLAQDETTIAPAPAPVVAVVSAPPAPASAP